MNILLLGSGGREHAFARKISESPRLENLYILPGNAGTALHGKNVNIALNDFESIKTFCMNYKIDIIVVGPEEPLVNGITDYFKNNTETNHIGVVGPGANAAILEGSKDFAKQFMKKYKIPTASYESFSKNNISDAIKFLKTLNPPYVLKADGLAAGKGVIICSSLEQASRELEEMLLQSKFGKAGDCVVIEEFLKGIELSVFVATDGNSYKLLPYAKDYKKIGENDKGLNTGGMGAVSPVPFVDKGLLDRIINSIIEPTVNGLKNENINYQGFIFFGLMVVDGLPYVIEYNARMGDPESEVVIPLLKTDIVDMFEAICNKTLNTLSLEINKGYAATVMLVSKGYPGEYKKGIVINIENKIKEDCIIFHAGTKYDETNRLLTNGGRVIAVTCFGEELKNALNNCYNNVGKVNFEGMYYRKDIGKDMLKYIK